MVGDSLPPRVHLSGRASTFSRIEYATIQRYVRHVHQQCQFIVMAHDGVLTANAQAVEGHDLRRASRPFKGLSFDEQERGRARGLKLWRDSERELWFSMQALLSAVANVHKTLWPRKEGPLLEARAPVREALGLGDESPLLLEGRNMRHHFDHYDDRIGDALASGEGLTITGIGAPITVKGHTRRVHDRNYDPATDTLSFWGVELDLAAVNREARRLIRIAEDVERLCPGCMDEGREHPVVFPTPRDFPA